MVAKPKILIIIKRLLLLENVEFKNTIHQKLFNIRLF